VGDFNHDGKLDLAVATDSGTGVNGTVSVLLGNGDGTFQQQVPYTVGFTCNGITAADLNGDGNIDLAVACAFNNTVAILLGNGDGSFQQQVSYATGTGPWGLLTADLNGDGIPDLAVSTVTGVLSVLRGNGDGTFQTHMDYAVGKPSLSVAVGDFNGDGMPDLVVSNESVIGDSTVSVLLGAGDGNFNMQVEYSVGEGAKGVAVGDFNRDGHLDLVVANFLANTVSVLLGNGDGTFQPQLTYPGGIEPSGVAVGDFNGDGALDLAVCATYSNAFSILLGRGDGTFLTPLSYGAGTGPTSLAVADFNGDGRLDVAVTDGDVSMVSALLQSPASLSATSLLFPDQPIKTRGPAQVVTLTNVGKTTLSVGKIFSDSRDFQVQSGCPRTVAAGGACAITVRFAPATEGAKVSAVEVNDGAGGSPQRIVVAGQGVE
jgi:hypothetical protein